MRFASRLLVAVAVLSAIAGCRDGAGEAASRPLQVFAAASLVDLAGELGRAFEGREGLPVELNLAASNTLAQQILAAPGADLFLSADRQWVEVLERAGRVVPGSRRSLLRNRLVLIASSRAEIVALRPEQLSTCGFSHLAMADPDAVPAGRYARAALAEVPLDGGTVWQAVAGRVAPALDVRAALALVESDPKILGIVYRTDAEQSDRVRVLYEFPAGGAARVTYHGALVAGGGQPAAGRRFLDFIAGPEGRRIAERHGFGAPTP